MLPPSRCARIKLPRRPLFPLAFGAEAIARLTGKEPLLTVEGLRLARYRMLFDRNIAGVFRSTLDGRILDCNESLAKYLGYDSREELLAQPAWNLYHQRADREELIRLLQQNRTMLNMRMPFRRKDGTSLLGMISASIVHSSTDEPQLLGTMVEA